MKKNVSIINISSIAGKRGSKNNSAYSASKFGVNGLTQSLSKEFGLRNIRVNAICPVLVKTKGLIKALYETSSPAQSNPKKFIDKFRIENAALNHLPTASEVADLCYYLGSENSSAINAKSSPARIRSLKTSASAFVASTSLIAEGINKTCLVSHCSSNFTSGPLFSSSLSKWNPDPVLIGSEMNPRD